MIITDDIQPLDDVLSSDHSICILVGQQKSPSGIVHSCLETRTWGNEPWNSWFLITDLSELSDEKIKEIRKCFEENSSIDYAFLGRNTKTVTSRGVAKDDLLDKGECDFLKIIAKFAEADLQ